MSDLAALAAAIHAQTAAITELAKATQQLIAMNQELLAQFLDEDGSGEEFLADEDS